MKIRIITGLLGLLLLLTVIVALPVHAFTPPPQGTDNATDIILWYGENFTIESIESGNFTITIPEFKDALGDALVAAANTTATLSSEQQDSLYLKILEIFLIVLINFMAYLFRERWLCVLGGFALMIFGWGLWVDIPYLSIILVLWGLYNFAKAWRDTGYWERQ